MTVKDWPSGSNPTESGPHPGMSFQGPMAPREFDLQRFMDAQMGVYPRALEELQRGAKASHWMWFVLPQIEGLGSSPMAQRYAIRDLAEARAYLKHDTLGPRLIAAVKAANRHAGRGAAAVFGSPDDLKFRSCVTLFALADPDEPAFAEALDRYFAGEPDAATVERVRASVVGQPDR